MLARADVGLECPPGGDSAPSGRAVRATSTTVSAPLAGQDEGAAPGQVGVVDPGQVEGDPRRRGRPRPTRGGGSRSCGPGPGAGRAATSTSASRASAPPGQGPGHHRARPLGGEDPVDPQAGPAAVGGGGGAGEHGVEGRAQLVEAPARPGVDGQHRRGGGRRTAPGAPRPRGGPAPAGRRPPGRPWTTTTTPWRIPRRSRMRRCSSLWGIHPSVAATTRSAASTAPTPASMFFRNRTWPGTSTKPTSCPDGSVGEGEAEVDGQAPGLLLGEAVGVGAGQGQDQRGLAVVDVAGGGDDPHQPTAGERAAASRSSSAGSTVRRSQTTAPRPRPGPPRRRRGVRPARRRGRATSTATPADGMPRPGSDPPPATASVSTTLAPGTRAATAAARSAQGLDRAAVAIRHRGIRRRRPRAR